MEDKSIRKESDRVGNRRIVLCQEKWQRVEIVEKKE
jgi:hypothetical protein